MKRSRDVAGLNGGQAQPSNQHQPHQDATVDPLECISALQDYERQLRGKAPTQQPPNKQPRISNLAPSGAREKLAKLVADFAGSIFSRKQLKQSSQLQQGSPPQSSGNPPKTLDILSTQQNISRWDTIGILLPKGRVAAAGSTSMYSLPSVNPSESADSPTAAAAAAGALELDPPCPDSPCSSPISSSSTGGGSPEPQQQQQQIIPDVVDLTLDTDTESDAISDNPGYLSELNSENGPAGDADSEDDDIQIVDPPAQQQHQTAATAAATGAAADEAACSDGETESGSLEGQVDSNTADRAVTAITTTGREEVVASPLAQAAVNTAAAAAATAGLAAAAPADSDSSNEAIGSNSPETSSDNRGSSSSSSGDDSGSDGKWTPSKRVRHVTNSSSRRPINRRLAAADTSPYSGAAAADHHCSTTAAAAAAEVAEQVTPPNTLSTKQQQQQRQDQTPVMTEQQRIKAAADCKSPGTPQILLLPCGLIGSSSGSLMAAAATQQLQDQRDASGRRVLGEVQPGQIRGLLTPRSKIKSNKIQISKQQQQGTSDLLIEDTMEIMVDATPVKKGTTARGAAAAPETPEIAKPQHTPQQQQQQHEEEEDQQDTRLCKDKRQQQKQQSVITPKALAAVAAAAATVSAARPSSQQQQVADWQASAAHQVPPAAAAAVAAAAVTAAAAERTDKPFRGHSSGTPAAAATSNPYTSSSLLSPRKSPAAAAAADPKLAAAAAAPRCAVVCPPMSDCRTMSYVRTPRQPGVCRPAGMTKRALREAAPQVYREASTTAYNSGSNPDWTSSSSSNPPASRNDNVNALLACLSSSSTTKPEGAGHLSIKPTLEQRVQCAYLRMRLTEAAAAGAGWAVLDLAGLPVDASEEAVEACRQKYAAERSVLLKCRSLAQVAAEDKRAAAVFSWIKEVRLAAAAAAQSCQRQGVLKRITPVVSSLPQWQLGGLAAAAVLQQQRPRVRFSADVQELTRGAKVAAAAAAVPAVAPV